MPDDIKLSPEQQKLYEELKAVRARTDVKLPPSPILRQEIAGLDGVLQPFTFRYYQVQGIYHMLRLKRMVLGDSTGLGKCTTLDTRLITDRGQISLAALKPEGDLVEGFYDLPFPVNVWTGLETAPVRRFYWGGIKPTVRVTTRNGFVLEGSRVHPVLIRSATGEVFSKLPALNEGDFVCIDRNEAYFPETEPELKALDKEVSPNRGFKYPERLTPDLAALLGWHIAEGCRHPTSVNVAQYIDSNPECHAEIERLFQVVFGWFNLNKRDLEKVNVCSQDIRRFLIGCGLAEVLAAGKEVPECVLRGSRESVRRFLSAYMEAEGSVASCGFEVSSASEKLIKQVQGLLLRFGVVSTRSPKHVKGYEHTYWRLSFFSNDARTFQEKIGLISTRKREAFRDTLQKDSNPNKDVIPHSIDHVGALKALLLKATSRSGANANRKGSGIKQFGHSFQSTFTHILTGVRDPTYQWLDKLLAVASELGLEKEPEYQEVQRIRSNNYFYDPVVKIEQSEAEVADLEIEHHSHCFSGNGFINHNTIETIGTLAYLWEKRPETKVIVVAPKSAIRQWSDEIERFTKGVKVYIATAPKEKGESPIEARERIYEAWANAPSGPNDPKAVLILNYALLIRDWNHGGFQPLKPNGQPDPKAPVLPGLLDKITKKVAENLTVIFDEATAFKSMRTKTWEVVRFLSDRSNRVYALTATLLKNNLMEGYCIYKAILPTLFGAKTKFMEDYTFYELKSVGRAKVPVIKGYKNLDHFKAAIDLYFLGRQKHVVSKELPVLTTREITCELNEAEVLKYREALTGILELGDGQVKEFEETKALTSLIYCQQVVNSLSLLKFNEGDEVGGFDLDLKVAKIGNLCSKEQALLDLLTEDLEGDKVIVYTRFESLVARLQEILKKNGIRSARITGKEKDTDRQKAKAAFQDLKSDVKVIFITAAGSEAINLQAAAGMIFYDQPWSWGDYVQCLDMDTEVLTKRGFLKRVEIGVEDSVAALDPISSSITWQPILSLTDRALAPGESMYSIKNQHIDIRVTGGHRMVFKRKTSKDHEPVWPDEWEFVTCEELSKEKSEFRLPVSGLEALPTTEAPVTDSELRFIGWFMSDGTYNKKIAQIQIVQAEHQPQIHDLRACLQECGFDWKEYRRDPSKIKGCYPNGKPQIQFAIPKGVAKGSRKRNGWNHLAAYLDKGLAPIMEDLSPRQLGVFLEALHLGDGAKNYDSSWTQRTYHISTGSKVFANRLQSLCLRRGYHCNLYEPRESTTIIRIKEVTHRSLSGGRTAGRPKFDVSPHVEGERVWCVENPVGTLVTRRNGKVAIVGNCLGRMIRIGSPHTGVMAYHLLAELPEVAKKDRKTIDHHVLGMLRKKKNLIDKVLGEAAIGALEFDSEGSSSLKDLVRAMQGKAT